MVNKGQSGRIDEGRQVLSFLAKNFTAEQFQPALVLIGQRYPEDQTLGYAELELGVMVLTPFGISPSAPSHEERILGVSR